MIHLANNFGLGLDKGVWAPILGTLCVLLGTLIALGGPDVIKGTNRFLVVALLFVGLIIVGICFVAVPIRDIMNVQPAIQENFDPSIIMNFVSRVLLNFSGVVSNVFVLVLVVIFMLAEAPTMKHKFAMVISSTPHDAAKEERHIDRVCKA